MRSKFATVDNTNIHYLEHGSSEKPALLILHGMHGDAAAVSTLSEYVSDTFRVICPDLPGYGFSDELNPHYDIYKTADLLNKLMDNIKVEQYYLGGISMGGAIALEMLMKMPENKMGMLFLEPYYSLNLIKKSHIKLEVLDFITQVFETPTLLKTFENNIFENNDVMKKLLQIFSNGSMNRYQIYGNLRLIRTCTPKTYLYTIHSVFHYKPSIQNYVSDKDTILILSKHDNVLDFDGTYSSYKNIFPNLKLEMVDYDCHNPIKKPSKEEIARDFPNILVDIDKVFGIKSAVSAIY